jgi:thiol-disulfide isomerase/thioredoxin
LQNCGPARDLPGITQWLNTEGGEALDLEELRGQVVLIDFWTYSCINCQRTLPYLTAWDERYRDQGLVIIGVHSPEFAFEKVPANVADAAERYGVEYPIALDNDFTTWREWDQRFWPAHYLIDKDGTVRQVHYGEGAYDETEALIRQLLGVTGGAAKADAEAAERGTSGRTQETYLGYRRLEWAENSSITPGEGVDYGELWVPELNNFVYGGTWDIEEEYAKAGADASLALHFYAADVFLVLAGVGTVTVTLNGDPETRHVVEVSGTPDLRTLYSGEPIDAVMLLEFSEGVSGYAFTFG